MNYVTNAQQSQFCRDVSVWYLSVTLSNPLVPATQAVENSRPRSSTLVSHAVTSILSKQFMHKMRSLVNKSNENSAALTQYLARKEKGGGVRQRQKFCRSLRRKLQFPSFINAWRQFRVVAGCAIVNFYWPERHFARSCGSHQVKLLRRHKSTRKFQSVSVWAEEIFTAWRFREQNKKVWFL